VVTHPNEYFHTHYIDDQANISGHLEAYSVVKGTILKLPVE
jgi:alpha-acetolactate decarboxylase